LNRNPSVEVDMLGTFRSAEREKYRSSRTSGVDNTQPISPKKALALLSTLQSADIVLPTTDGREIRLRRLTEPTGEQKSMLHQPGLSLPERLKSLSRCSADSAIA